jgi:hypothetical protein
VLSIVPRGDLLLPGEGSQLSGILTKTRVTAFRWSGKRYNPRDVASASPISFLDEYQERMQRVTSYLLMVMLGAALAGAGFASASAGGTTQENRDIAFYLWAKARTGEAVDPAIGLAAGLPDQSARERTLLYAALRDLAHNVGADATADDLIRVFETVRSAVGRATPT